MKDLNAYISIAEESSKPTGKIPTFDRSAQVDLGEDMAKRLAAKSQAEANKPAPPPRPFILPISN